MRTKGAVARWIVSIAMLIALIAVTAGALRWYQPLRALFDDYLEVEVAQDRTVEPEPALRPQQETYAPNELISIEEPAELVHDNQESVATPDPIVGFDTEIPVSVSPADVFSARDANNSARIELGFALVSIASDLDIGLATDALQRAHSIASTNRMSPSIVRSVEQALAEIEKFGTLNLESIQDRLDTLSKLIVSIGSVRSDDPSVTSPDTSINVSEQPESQSFWNELSGGIANVYSVRRIDETTSKAEAFLVETSAQLRLIVMLERARSDIRMYDFDSYRAALEEAIGIVDSLSQEHTAGLNSIKDELFDLVNLELVSPHQSIRTALGELTSEAAKQTVESTSLDP